VRRIEVPGHDCADLLLLRSSEAEFGAIRLPNALVSSTVISVAGNCRVESDMSASLTEEQLARHVRRRYPSMLQYEAEAKASARALGLSMVTLGDVLFDVEQVRFKHSVRGPYRSLQLSQRRNPSAAV